MYQKKLNKHTPKRKITVFSVLLVVVVCFVGLLLYVKTARSVAPDANFRITMPYPYDASQANKVYLEVAQVGSGEKGNGNRLDASESWSKFYIDKNRIDETTLGIYAGGYGGAVDSLGFNSAGSGNRFSDKDAVKYEFFLGIDDATSAFEDEVPCTVKGDYASSLTLYSGEMSVDGWYKGLRASRFYANASCNNKGWDVTQKSGKYVLFMKASWNTPQPSDAAGKLGRLNAFKVGAAYDNPKDQYDNPLTGYWSDFDAATSSANPQRAAYSLQDRISADGTQGDYTFSFGTDCRIAPGQTDPTPRYLHWRDVDYPDYYGSATPPTFTLYDIAPGGGESIIYTAEAGKRLPNGTFPFNGDGKENIYNYLKFTGTGGHKYRWEWKNITRVDGVSLWLPYDDYPSLAGCGSFSYGVGLKAGAGAPGNATSFEVYGGQKVVAQLTPLSGGPDAGPDYDLSLKLDSKTGNSINSFLALKPPATVDPITATVGGRTTAASVNSRTLGWDNLPRMGQAAPYSPTRDDIFAYFNVSEEAPDGARYCFTGTISPRSNSNAGPFGSSPPQVCFTINNSLKPFITTIGGDVHAGDCTITSPSNGKITGQGVSGSDRGSAGSYIVSAGDAITKFGSGGTPGATNLSFGKTGRYGCMRRPDLKTMMAELNKDKHETILANPNQAFDLSTLTAGKRYVVKFDDLGLSSGVITGKSSASVTVVSANTITIQGSDFGSNVSASSSRTNLPVVGVIAKDIKIKKEVDGVTAQLYATGNIDTCSDSTAAACRKILFLRGFAMANDFSFKRSGTGSNGLQLAELFNFNAAFYLNPPPGFGSAAGTIKYLGERAPLY